ncbi:MAG: amino acid adenylation domain-containing protein, partial [Blastocatellia bacterium]
IDLSGLVVDVPLREVHGLEADANRPFDLAAGPLLRTMLLRLASEEHVLLATMHHIIGDAWSMGIITRELTELYEGYSLGLPSSLAELPIQYADYAVWQRQWLQGVMLRELMSYWRQQLASVPTLELPADRPRPAVGTLRGAFMPVGFGPELTGLLKQFSQREGITLFMTLLSGFFVLLSRYAAEDDVVVGTTIANRTRTQTEGLIGFFINALPLRASLKGEPTWRELARRVRNTALDAYGHQELPFEKLIEELQPERDLSRSPLFQVLIELQNTPDGELLLGNLNLSRVEAAQQAAKFDLRLSLHEDSLGISGVLEYNGELFDPDTIRRMAGHYRRLLEALVTEPGQRTVQAQMLSAEERHQMLVDWNGTASEYPDTRCLHQCFEAQVLNAPDAIALQSGHCHVSFRELNQQANQLAHYLRGLGVGVEVVVALLLERSIDLVISTLAILKAGGAYLPIDTKSPLERLALVLEQTRPPVLITREPLLHSLPVFWGQVVCLEDHRDWIAAQDTGDPLTLCNAENLAYVIYTSGSTGVPKGVMITHRGVVNYLTWCSEAYKISDGRGAPVHSALAFDLTVTSLYAPLVSGRTAQLADQDDVEGLWRLAQPNTDYSLVKLTPAHLDLLSRKMGSEGVAEWSRALVIGGEALRCEHLRAWQVHSPKTRLINEYGPTETVVGCCIYEVKGPIEPGDEVPIGTPIANTRMYLAGEGGQVVPLGVMGEIHIGGDGVGRGYYTDGARTAEKFIPDEHSGAIGGRLYRSGDTGKYRRHGDLLCLGRVDRQVKLRGYRIELGEIEACINSHPEVREAVVEVHEDAHGLKRLVAYVSTKETGMAPIEELRRHLMHRLPEYMVPSAFVTIEKLPLTSNGKVDRSCLPQLRDPGLQRGTVDRAPLTVAEELLAGIWREVLGVDDVDTGHNFFLLGGHSLLATRVVSRIRDVFGLELPLQALFESPTLGELAGVIEVLRLAGGRSEVPPIVPANRERSLPLSFGQERLWFIHQLEPEGTAYNIPVALRLMGVLKFDALVQALREIVGRHEVLRTRYADLEGFPVQVIGPVATLTTPLVDVTTTPLELQKLVVSRQILNEALRPFDLAAGPPFRVSILRLADGDYVLLATMHHIVSDAWSASILSSELSRLYQAYSTGDCSPLPDLPVQYADYAVWQREWLQGEHLEGLLRYWRHQLAGAPLVLDLPADRSRSSVQSYDGARIPFEVPGTLTRRIRDLGQEHGVTVFMVLLACFQVLLTRYTGQSDFLVGSPIANRTTSMTERLIGFFVNALVLRVVFKPKTSCRDLLELVKESTLGAYAHQDMPFEKLVEELQPERALDRTPLFQVMIVSQNPIGKEFDLPGLR